jgi:hypothetical protein
MAQERELRPNLPEVPTHCNRCNGELEIAHERQVVDNQQSAWWFFNNGTRVICRGDLPPPKRCNHCALGFFVEPGGKLVNGVGGF